MDKLYYKLSIGGWSVDSANDPRTELIELDTRMAISPLSDYGRLSIYAPPAPQPGLLEQAVGAAAGALGLGGAEEETLSVQVRGNAIKLGDQLTVELTAGSRTGKVITADLRSISSSLGETRIAASTAKQSLAIARLNQIYENQSMDQIVKDLAGQTGVQTGDVDTGSTYPYFVVHESKSVLSHIQSLALRDGLDLYFDESNKLMLKKFTKTSPDHTLYYGIDVIDLRLGNHQPVNHVLVYGESPASNQGSDTWHWLAKDLSPFRSEAGQGTRTVAINDGAVRTKDAADLLATSKLGAITDQAGLGRLKMLGNPEIKLGQAIEIKNAPKPELNGLFRVATVRHLMNKRDGYLTYVEFTGQGGAEKAGGLLGAAGQLAGALGL